MPGSDPSSPLAEPDTCADAADSSTRAAPSFDRCGPDRCVGRATIVMTRDAPLPDRCVKCNAPVGERLMRRTLTWHHPAIYLIILAGPVV